MTDLLERHLDVQRLDPVSTPFPHALADPFFRPAVYEGLRAEFPNMVESAVLDDGLYSLYWGDEAYDKHLERSPAWKDAFEMVHSQTFVDFVIDSFGDHWEREGCALDLSKASYVPYLEDRGDKGSLGLHRVEHDPHELWCRLDFYETSEARYRTLHRDQRRRLISMLVCFDDARDRAGHGEDLTLHSCGPDLELLRRLGAGRVPRAYSLLRDRVAATRTVTAQANRLITLLNSNRSWHSVAQPEVTRLPARWIRIVVSSSVDVWR